MRVKTALMALSVLAGSLARAQTPANGFYQIVESGGIAVKELRGGEIHLGEKLPNVFSSAVIFSVDNYNQQFYISLPIPELLSFNPSYTPPGFFFPSGLPQIALYVDGFCLRVWGLSRGSATMLNIAYTSPAAAQAFGRFLGVTPRLRAHPGYALATRFVPTKVEFALDRPVVVTLEIKNVGNVSVAFQVLNRYGRDEQFGFSAHGPGGGVLELGLVPTMGGWADYKTLNPGETFTRDVDLRAWFSLSRPGSYTITGTYLMQFLDGTSRDVFNFLIWQDQIAATFTVNLR